MILSHKQIFFGQSGELPHGSILGPLPFLLYIHDLLQVVKYNIFLYADDSLLVSQHRDFKKIGKLNKNFESFCYCFVDNKLSTHFCDDKSKSLFFATKFKNKKSFKKS